MVGKKAEIRMKPGNIILVVNDNAVFGSALSYSLRSEYEIETCPNTYEAVGGKLRTAGGDMHAIVLDADLLNNKDCFNAKGISLVGPLRTNIKTNLPIVMMSFNDILPQHEQEKYFFLTRKGYYFTQQPFLLPRFFALLAGVERCNLEDDIKGFKILQYGVILKHQCVDKFEGTPTEELTGFWEKNRYVYSELGVFGKELKELDEAVGVRNREKMKISFLSLFIAGTNYILRKSVN